MNKLLIAFLLAPLFSVSQDCKSYYLMTTNSTVEMTIFDKKGKESGKQAWKISEVKKNGSGFQSQVNSTFMDEKGKVLSSGSGIYKCDGSVLKADIRMSMPQEQMQAYNT